MRLIKGDTRSLDYSSYSPPFKEFSKILIVEVFGGLRIVMLDPSSRSGGLSSKVARLVLVHRAQKVG